LHGDERLGPNACIEFMEILLTNFNKDAWFKYLLQNRYMVILPMANPYGYQAERREELLAPTENSSVTTDETYQVIHKDINRDFPILVNPKNCMVTVGARVINEILIRHMFILTFSLHAGDESLTYPYGTPNHMLPRPKNLGEIRVKYTQEGNKLKAEPEPDAEKTAQAYRNLIAEEHTGKSTESFDFSTFNSK
jgi:hypothetical protein